MTTFNLLLLMNGHGTKKFAFASSSAIYGSLDVELKEESGPLFPISNYGAMKLASEGIISAAAEAFLERVWIFRFPNVVGGRGTHGVIYDLLGKLQRNQNELTVLGDGKQCKPYLHVSDLIDCLIFIRRNGPDRINCYNIGQTDDGATVSFIAQEVVKGSGCDARIVYTGGNQGWAGDVPRFAYSTQKLSGLGWRPRLGSRDAVRRAVSELALEKGFPCS
jgi:UDP-glucose 4-epimerase